MKALRMAVVGTGALGRHHARILADLPGVELVAVADVNAAAAAATAERCRTRAIVDYRELIGQVDAVVVAVPTFGHRAVAGDFLAADVDVFVEKPIAASVDEGREMVALAARHGRLLQVGHVERYNPAYVAARPFLADPKFIRAERFSPFSFRSTDIGVVHDLMIHDIDLVLQLVGAPVVDVEAFGVSILGELEDCVQARMKFANGAVADLAANRVSPVTSRRMQVWGPEGCVQLDFGAREVIRFSPSTALRYGSGPLEKARHKGADIEKLKGEIFGTFIEVHRPHVVPRDQLTEELLEFTACVRTRKAPPVGGDAALQALIVAARILEQVAVPPWAATSVLPRRQAG